jgi:sialate O-acetylesterase
MFQRKFYFLPLFLLLYQFIHSQTIVLPDNWIFTIGDDPAYKNEVVDESKWIKIRVPGNWEDQGFPNYDGFAWYRLHFEVDDDLGEQPLYLFLGKIDDLDETFLNGVR